MNSSKSSLILVLVITYGVIGDDETTRKSDKDVTTEVQRPNSNFTNTTRSTSKTTAVDEGTGDVARQSYRSSNVKTTEGPPRVTTTAQDRTTNRNSTGTLEPTVTIKTTTNDIASFVHIKEQMGDASNGDDIEMNEEQINAPEKKTNDSPVNDETKGASESISERSDTRLDKSTEESKTMPIGQLEEELRDDGDEEDDNRNSETEAEDNVEALFKSDTTDTDPTLNSRRMYNSNVLMDFKNNVGPKIAEPKTVMRPEHHSHVHQDPHYNLDTRFQFSAAPISFPPLSVTLPSLPYSRNYPNQHFQYDPIFPPLPKLNQPSPLRSGLPSYFPSYQDEVVTNFKALPNWQTPPVQRPLQPLQLQPPKVNVLQPSQHFPSLITTLRPLNTFPYARNNNMNEINDVILKRLQQAIHNTVQPDISRKYPDFYSTNWNAASSYNFFSLGF